MCLPRTKRYLAAKIIDSNMIALPPAEQLLKTKTKPLPQTPPAPVTPPATPPAKKSVKKSVKSVRFHEAVRVALFERASAAEAKLAWYGSSEMEAMKAEGSELAAAYRKLCANGGGGDDKKKKVEYRGFENQTITRKRQMVLANRCAIHAHERGMSSTEIACLYGRCAAWSSTKVAFIQAVHDHLEVSDGEEGDNAFAGIPLPPVSSMVPPRPIPFAVQSVRALRSKAATKRSSASLQKDAAAASRRVRQRVAR